MNQTETFAERARPASRGPLAGAAHASGGAPWFSAAAWGRGQALAQAVDLVTDWRLDGRLGEFNFNSPPAADEGEEAARRARCGARLETALALLLPQQPTAFDWRRIALDLAAEMGPQGDPLTQAIGTALLAAPFAGPSDSEAIHATLQAIFEDLVLAYGDGGPDRAREIFFDDTCFRDEPWRNEIWPQLAAHYFRAAALLAEEVAPGSGLAGAIHVATGAWSRRPPAAFLDLAAVQSRRPKAAADAVDCMERFVRMYPEGHRNVALVTASMLWRYGDGPAWKCSQEAQQLLSALGGEGAAGAEGNVATPRRRARI